MPIVIITGKAIIDSKRLSNLRLGICWSNTNPQPTLKDSYFTSLQSYTDGVFDAYLDNLADNQTYYYRPYLKENSKDIYYAILSELVPQIASQH